MFKLPFHAKTTAEEVVEDVDLAGRVMLVTGCNSGIGFETMRVLASRGAQVIGLARSLDSAAMACSMVKGKPLAAVLAVAQLFFKTREQGAATQCLLAASPLVEGISGKYWMDCQMAEGSIYLDDRPMAERLWNLSEELLARNLRVAA